MNAHEPADRADVLRELGELDELTVDRILAHGPRIADLVEVRVRLTQEDELDELGRTPPPVVAEVLRILRDALRQLEEEDEEPGTVTV